MTIRKTFYPSKEFDDKFAALATLFATEGWELPGFTAEMLADDAAAQRIERDAHDAARRDFLAKHEEFGLAQLARYQRFMAVLEALRGIFRDDKVTLAKLKALGRGNGRPRKAAGEPAGKEEAA